ncbi:hypothetical protein CRUP_012218 [Coryphaenoides rupestris]|nr:hypothetical protein CRUP_012218 [Coryphaenoides rupestris]
MGIEEEADRTLFIRNLDQRVSEEMLFELFLQKTFGFAVYRHEESVPYAMQLLNGMPLFGKTLGVQFRSGSSHGNSPGMSQNANPATTPNPHGLVSPVQLKSPPYSSPPQMQKSYSSPDSLQKQVVSTHGRDNYHHNDRRGGRHHDNGGGGSRPYDTNRGGNRGVSNPQENLERVPLRDLLRAYRLSSTFSQSGSSPRQRPGQFCEDIE